MAVEKSLLADKNTSRLVREILSDEFATGLVTADAPPPEPLTFTQKALEKLSFEELSKIQTLRFGDFLRGFRSSAAFSAFATAEDLSHVPKDVYGELMNSVGHFLGFKLDFGILDWAGKGLANTLGGTKFFPTWKKSITNYWNKYPDRREKMVKYGIVRPFMKTRATASRDPKLNPGYLKTNSGVWDVLKKLDAEDGGVKLPKALSEEIVELQGGELVGALNFGTKLGTRGSIQEALIAGEIGVYDRNGNLVKAAEELTGGELFKVGMFGQQILTDERFKLWDVPLIRGTTEGMGIHLGAAAAREFVRPLFKGPDAERIREVFSESVVFGAVDALPYLGTEDFGRKYVIGGLVGGMFGGGFGMLKDSAVRGYRVLKGEDIGGKDAGAAGITAFNANEYERQIAKVVAENMDYANVRDLITQDITEERFNSITANGDMLLTLKDDLTKLMMAQQTPGRTRALEGVFLKEGLTFENLKESPFFNQVRNKLNHIYGNVRYGQEHERLIQNVKDRLNPLLKSEDLDIRVDAIKFEEGKQPEFRFVFWGGEEGLKKIKQIIPKGRQIGDTKDGMFEATLKLDRLGYGIPEETLVPTLKFMNANSLSKARQRSLSQVDFDVKNIMKGNKFMNAFDANATIEDMTTVLADPLLKKIVNSAYGKFPELEHRWKITEGFQADTLPALEGQNIKWAKREVLGDTQFERMEELIRRKAAIDERNKELAIRTKGTFYPNAKEALKGLKRASQDKLTKSERAGLVLPFFLRPEQLILESGNISKALRNKILELSPFGPRRTARFFAAAVQNYQSLPTQMRRELWQNTLLGNIRIDNTLKFIEDPKKRPIFKKQIEDTVHEFVDMINTNLGGEHWFDTIDGLTPREKSTLKYAFQESNTHISLRRAARVQDAAALEYLLNYQDGWKKDSKGNWVHSTKGRTQIELVPSAWRWDKDGNVVETNEPMVYLNGQTYTLREAATILQKRESFQRGLRLKQYMDEQLIDELHSAYEEDNAIKFVQTLQELADRTEVRVKGKTVQSRWKGKVIKNWLSKDRKRYDLFVRGLDEMLDTSFKERTGMSAHLLQKFVKLREANLGKMQWAKPVGYRIDGKDYPVHSDVNLKGTRTHAYAVTSPTPIPPFNFDKIRVPTGSSIARQQLSRDIRLGLISKDAQKSREIEIKKLEEAEDLAIEEGFQINTDVNSIDTHMLFAKPGTWAPVPKNAEPIFAAVPEVSDSYFKGALPYLPKTPYAMKYGEAQEFARWMKDIAHLENKSYEDWTETTDDEVGRPLGEVETTDVDLRNIEELDTLTTLKKLQKRAIELWIDPKNQRSDNEYLPKFQEWTVFQHDSSSVLWDVIGTGNLSGAPGKSYPKFLSRQFKHFMKTKGKEVKGTSITPRDILGFVLEMDTYFGGDVGIHAANTIAQVKAGKHFAAVDEGVKTIISAIKNELGNAEFKKIGDKWTTVEVNHKNEFLLKKMARKYGTRVFDKKGNETIKLDKVSYDKMLMEVSQAIKFKLAGKGEDAVHFARKRGPDFQILAKEVGDKYIDYVTELTRKIMSSVNQFDMDAPEYSTIHLRGDFESLLGRYSTEPQHSFMVEFIKDIWENNLSTKDIIDKVKNIKGTMKQWANTTGTQMFQFYQKMLDDVADGHNRLDSLEKKYLEGRDLEGQIRELKEGDLIDLDTGRAGIGIKALRKALQREKGFAINESDFNMMNVGGNLHIVPWMKGVNPENFTLNKMLRDLETKAIQHYMPLEVKLASRWWNHGGQRTFVIPGDGNVPKVGDEWELITWQGREEQFGGRRDVKFPEYDGPTDPRFMEEVDRYILKEQAKTEGNSETIRGIGPFKDVSQLTWETGDVYQDMWDAGFFQNRQRALPDYENVQEIMLNPEFQLGRRELVPGDGWYWVVQDFAGQDLFMLPEKNFVHHIYDKKFHKSIGPTDSVDGKPLLLSKGIKEGKISGITASGKWIPKVGSIIKVTNEKKPFYVRVAKKTQLTRDQVRPIDKKTEKAMLNQRGRFFQLLKEFNKGRKKGQKAFIDKKDKVSLAMKGRPDRIYHLKIPQKDGKMKRVFWFDLFKIMGKKEKYIERPWNEKWMKEWSKKSGISVQQLKEKYKAGGRRGKDNRPLNKTYTKDNFFNEFEVITKDEVEAVFPGGAPYPVIRMDAEIQGVMNEFKQTGHADQPVTVNSFTDNVFNPLSNAHVHPFEFTFNPRAMLKKWGMDPTKTPYAGEITMHFLSVDHAYQTLKNFEYPDMDVYSQILDNPTARTTSKKKAYSKDNMNLVLMQELMNAKFDSSPSLQDLLKRTVTRDINHNLGRREKGADFWNYWFPKLLNSYRQKLVQGSKTHPGEIVGWSPGKESPERVELNIVKPGEEVTAAQYYTVEELSPMAAKTYKDFLFVYETNHKDRNSKKKGTKGQARLRGLPNSIGIRVKTKPGGEVDSFINFDINDKKARKKYEKWVDEDVKAINDKLATGKFKGVVFPAKGIGWGSPQGLRSWDNNMLPKLTEALKDSFGFDNSVEHSTRRRNVDKEEMRFDVLEDIHGAGKPYSFNQQVAINKRFGNLAGHINGIAKAIDKLRKSYERTHAANVSKAIEKGKKPPIKKAYLMLNYKKGDFRIEELIPLEVSSFSAAADLVRSESIKQLEDEKVLSAAWRNYAEVRKGGERKGVKRMTTEYDMESYINYHDNIGTEAAPQDISSDSPSVQARVTSVKKMNDGNFEVKAVPEVWINRGAFGAGGVYERTTREGYNVNYHPNYKQETNTPIDIQVPAGKVYSRVPDFVREVVKLADQNNDITIPEILTRMFERGYDLRFGKNVMSTIQRRSMIADHGGWSKIYSDYRQGIITKDDAVSAMSNVIGKVYRGVRYFNPTKDYGVSNFIDNSIESVALDQAINEYIHKTDWMDGNPINKGTFYRQKDIRDNIFDMLLKATVNLRKDTGSRGVLDTFADDVGELSKVNPMLGIQEIMSRVLSQDEYMETREFQTILKFKTGEDLKKEIVKMRKLSPEEKRKYLARTLKEEKSMLGREWQEAWLDRMLKNVKDWVQKDSENEVIFKKIEAVREFLNKTESMAKPLDLNFYISLEKNAEFLPPLFFRGSNVINITDNSQLDNYIPMAGQALQHLKAMKHAMDTGQNILPDYLDGADLNSATWNPQIDGAAFHKDNQRTNFTLDIYPKSYTVGTGALHPHYSITISPKTNKMASDYYITKTFDLNNTLKMYQDAKNFEKDITDDVGEIKSLASRYLRHMKSLPNMKKTKQLKDWNNRKEEYYKNVFNRVLDLVGSIDDLDNLKIMGDINDPKLVVTMKEGLGCGSCKKKTWIQRMVTNLKDFISQEGSHLPAASLGDSNDVFLNSDAKKLRLDITAQKLGAKILGDFEFQWERDLMLGMSNIVHGVKRRGETDAAYLKRMADPNDKTGFYQRWFKAKDGKFADEDYDPGPEHFRRRAEQAMDAGFKFQDAIKEIRELSANHIKNNTLFSNAERAKAEASHQAYYWANLVYPEKGTKHKDFEKARVMFYNYVLPLSRIMKYNDFLKDVANIKNTGNIPKTKVKSGIKAKGDVESTFHYVLNSPDMEMTIGKDKIRDLVLNTKKKPRNEWNNDLTKVENYIKKAIKSTKEQRDEGLQNIRAGIAMTQAESNMTMGKYPGREKTPFMEYQRLVDYGFGIEQLDTVLKELKLKNPNNEYLQMLSFQKDPITQIATWMRSRGQWWDNALTFHKLEENLINVVQHEAKDKNIVGEMGYTQISRDYLENAISQGGFKKLNVILDYLEKMGAPIVKEFRDKMKVPKGQEKSILELMDSGLNKKKRRKLINGLLDALASTDAYEELDTNVLTLYNKLSDNKVIVYSKAKEHYDRMYKVLDIERSEGYKKFIEGSHFVKRLIMYNPMFHGWNLAINAAAAADLTNQQTNPRNQKNVDYMKDILKDWAEQEGWTKDTIDKISTMNTDNFNFFAEMVHGLGVVSKNTNMPWKEAFRQKSGLKVNPLTMPIDLTHPIYQFMIDNGFPMGTTQDMTPRMGLDQIDKETGATWREKINKTVGFKLFGDNIRNFSDDFLFRTISPAAEAVIFYRTFHNARHQLKKKNPKWSEPEIIKSAARVAERIATTMSGKLHKMDVNKVMDVIGRAALFANHWTVSNFRTYTGMLGYGNNLSRHDSVGRVLQSQFTAGVTRWIIYKWLISQLWNTVVTGHPTWENEPARRDKVAIKNVDGGHQFIELNRFVNDVWNVARPSYLSGGYVGAMLTRGIAPGGLRGMVVRGIGATLGAVVGGQVSRPISDTAQKWVGLPGSDNTVNPQAEMLWGKINPALGWLISTAANVDFWTKEQIVKGDHSSARQVQESIAHFFTSMTPINNNQIVTDWTWMDGTFRRRMTGPKWAGLAAGFWVSESRKVGGYVQRARNLEDEYRKNAYKVEMDSNTTRAFKDKKLLQLEKEYVVNSRRLGKEFEEYMAAYPGER